MKVGDVSRERIFEFFELSVTDSQFLSLILRFLDFNLGVPATPSGFPLYLFPLSLQKDAASIPNAWRLPCRDAS